LSFDDNRTDDCACGADDVALLRPESRKRRFQMIDDSKIVRLAAEQAFTMAKLVVNATTVSAGKLYTLKRTASFAAHRGEREYGSEPKLRLERVFVCGYRRVLGRLERRHFALGTGSPPEARSPLCCVYHVRVWRLPTDSQRGSGVPWLRVLLGEASCNQGIFHQPLQVASRLSKAGAEVQASSAQAGLFGLSGRTSPASVG
jgi:hypothetical protein